jgi:hypothetical protein
MEAQTASPRTLLEQGEGVFGGVRALLDEQYARLSALSPRHFFLQAREGRKTYRFGRRR